MRLTHIGALISIFAAGLAFAPAALPATPAATRWLVILNDKPVVQQYPGRVERMRAAAAPYRQHLQQVQASLRPQIEALHARVTGSVQHLANGMFVTATPAQVAALRKLPGVKTVMHIRAYRKAAALDQNALSGVQQAWSELSGGQSNAGAGIKIGIIDTGINQSHPAFQDSSLVPPSGYPLADNAADLAFTNNKVIVARSYVSDIVYSDVPVTVSDLASASRPDDLTARDLDGHGTAVAAVAAGLSTTYNNITVVGVAPKAFLGNYKVFGSDDVNPNGSGNILQALEDAYNDGMDVVNLSLGSPAYGGPFDEDASNCIVYNYPNPAPISFPTDACDPLAYLAENAMDDGAMTVVIAAGNQGANGYQFNYCGGSCPSTFGTVGSPAMAPSAIAVGGIQNGVTYVQHIEVSGLQAIDAFESYDGPAPDVPLTAPLVDADQIGNGTGCNAYASGVQGKIVLVTQGSCDDVTIVTNAQSAGAAGVIEIASATSFFLPYGLTATFIPTFIVGQSDGSRLKSYADATPGVTATLDPKPYQESAASSGYLPYSVAFFSSRGPVAATGGLKPDLVAAATDFLLPAETYDPYGELFNFSGYVTTQGTSFSTPMVTGSAALVKQANPNFSPLQIRSALVNTASTAGLLTADGSSAASVSEVGGGLLQTQSAVNFAANSPIQVVPAGGSSFNPYIAATISFGIVGSPLPTAQPLALANTSSSPVTVSLTVVPNSNVSQILVNGSPSASVTVPAATSSAAGLANVNISISGTTPPPGRYEGTVAVSGTAVSLSIPYMYVVPDGVPYDVIPLNGVEPGQGFPAFDGAVGAQIPWYQPCYNVSNICVNDYGPIAVQVIDQYGVPVAGVPVTWAVSPGYDGSVIQDSNYTDSVTNANGIAGAAVQLGSAGSQEFTATVAGMVLPFDGWARVPPTINTGGIIDGASFKLAAVSPGSLISVFGLNMTDDTQGNNGMNGAFDNCRSCVVVSQATPAGQVLPMGIDGASFSFDTSSQSVAGRMLYVSPQQMNLQIPWEMAGESSAVVKSIVNYTYSNEYTLTIAPFAPGFFQNPLGSNDAAARDNDTGTVVSSSTPVARGKYVQLYMGGLGVVNCPYTAGSPSCTSDNLPVDGVGAPLSPLASTPTNPTITIGGQPATVVFSGLAPNFVGLYQVNVLVPENIGTGRQPVTCTMGTVTAVQGYLYIK